MNTEKVTRFEIIDHTPCKDCGGSGRFTNMFGDRECVTCSGTGCVGRQVISHNKDTQFDVELQDEGRTLKVFMHKRYS